WTSKHALDVLLRQRLRVLCPLHGHRLWTRDITNHDWRTGSTGTIRLHPTICCDYEAIEKLCEVLHHFIALWIAMKQHIHAQPCLQLNHVRNCLAQFSHVLLITQVAGAMISACLADV